RVLLHEIDLTPQIPITQKDGRTTGMRGDKSFISEGVADLVDVTLSDWHNEINLGRISLFDDPMFVDDTNFAALFPGTMAPDDFATGLFTRIRFHEILINFSVSTVPTTRSALVAGLIFFCPVCFAALWEQGSATVTLTDLQMP